MTAAYEHIAEHLQPSGLIPRGAFHIAGNPDMTRELLARIPTAQTAVLIGHGGGAFWRHFQSWCAEQPSLSPNPLDRWSEEIITSVADKLKAEPVFPWFTPYLPFQRWACASEGLQTAPVGVLMHPEFGVWHAYRGALVFTDQIEIPSPQSAPHHCDTCADKPCLSTCPVDAFVPTGFDVKACAAYLNEIAGTPAKPNCHDAGCAARNACPVATQHRYAPEQQRFHMRAYHNSVGPLASTNKSAS